MVSGRSAGVRPGWARVDVSASVRGRRWGVPRRATKRADEHVLDAAGRERLEHDQSLAEGVSQRSAAVLPGRSGTGRGADSFCFRI
jgi:hypothetical protein